MKYEDFFSLRIFDQIGRVLVIILYTDAIYIFFFYLVVLCKV